jgi:heme exporter protein CcmD
MSDMLAMGDYGAYVWSSFGITLLVLVICAVQGVGRHKAMIRQLTTRLNAMESNDET